MISEQEPVKNHYGNNTATTFDFDFYIEDESQLSVTHTDLEGNTNTLEYGVDYSIHELKNSQGSYITFPLEGSNYDVLAWDITTDTKELLSIALTLPISQEAEYKKSSNLNQENLEYSFDYLTRICQILQRQLYRAVKVSEGANANADELFQDFKDEVNDTVAAAKSAIDTSMTNFKDEVDTSITNQITTFKTEVNETIAANKTENETEIQNFEDKVNTTIATNQAANEAAIQDFKDEVNETIDTVNEAAAKINAMDEAVETCKTKAEEVDKKSEEVETLLNEFYTSGISGGNASSVYDSTKSISGGNAAGAGTTLLYGGNAFTTGSIIGDLIENVRTLRSGVSFALTEIGKYHKINYFG